MESSDQTTVYFARTNFRGEDRIFGIKTKDRRQHMYVVGKTGCGKSVMLKNIAAQDIQNGAGVAVVDPHGELVEEILASVPPHRINDVIYFNPADADYPIGFNVLEVPDPKYKHVVASDLMGIFTKIWANVWSARMEYIMQNCIMALLDTPGTTLLGVPRLLVDREYRAKIVANIKDPVVKAFWTQEYENYTDRLRSEAIVPIQNKVGQFLNTSMVRNIVGQPKSGFNVQDVMNSGKILLVNVSKGRIGEDNSALLGAMMITKLQLGAMERVRVPENERKDFYLYVDEFQNFATDSFASVLSEARKYRLNLIIAHQYIGQLVTEQSTKVRDAVFGNAGTIVTFRIGAGDAEFLETEFTPEFLPADLVNLPNYHIYTKLMVDGVTSRPFSATTLPPIPVEESVTTVEKVIKVARERYATPRAEVEDRIMRWSGMAVGTESDSVDGGDDTMPVSSGFQPAWQSRGRGEQATGANAAWQKEEFEAVCASCAKNIKVPFKPDPRRPVYCQTCLKKVKEGEILPVSMPRSAAPARPHTPTAAKRAYDDSLGTLGIEFDTAGPERKAPPAAHSGRTFQDRLSRNETSPARHAGGQSDSPRRLAQALTPVKRAVSGLPSVTGQLSTAICARCGKETHVTFRPDGRRPVYCKTCLPFIRSEEMKKLASRPVSLQGERNVRRSGQVEQRQTAFASPTGIFTRTAPAAKVISLKDTLRMDGVTFSGKKLKRKEVDLTSLREALHATLETQELPDAPDFPSLNETNETNEHETNER